MTIRSLRFQLLVLLLAMMLTARDPENTVDRCACNRSIVHGREMLDAGR